MVNSSRFQKFRTSSKALAAISLLSWIGCAPQISSDSDSTSTGTTSTSSSTTDSYATSCSSSTIDAGQKGIVTAVNRGIHSDIRINPLNGSPATAFTDPGAQTIKLTYSSGASDTTETISGDGTTGTYVRLAFTSNGVPFVFWAQGTNVKVAIRSAALSSAGTWQSGVIDTGTAPRALEVSVNPLDQIALTFQTDTATTGRAKTVYCDTGCLSPSNFLTLTPNAYIENANINATVTSSGVAWCKNNSTSYYPAIAYINSATNKARFMICKNTLANCLSSANWTGQDIVTTTASNLGIKLHIDATTVGDVPKVILHGASGFTPLKMGSACTAALSAFTAGSVVGLATAGSSWMQLMSDPTTGAFHAIANVGTASIRYWNSQTNNITGTWNSDGIIETTTLQAGSGGGALESATYGVYSSYALNVAPFSIRSARVLDYRLASSDTNQTFSKTDVDSSGGIQLPPSVSPMSNIATASTSTGRPAVVYVDFSVGAATGAKLKYAFRSGNSATDNWFSSVIPSTTNPQYAALAFDSSNKPWIGYFDSSPNRFYLATNSSSDGSGAWTKYDFPAIPSGAPVALPAANNIAITMRTVSGVKHPVMIVADTNATSKGIKAAILNVNTRAWSAPVTVDGLTGGSTGASNVAADADSSGNVVVAFRDLNASSNRVKYSMTSNGTTWSTPLQVSGLNQGAGLSVHINPKTGSPAMSYYDRAANIVYLASCSGTPSGCASSGWSSVAVDSSTGVSGLSLTQEQLLGTSLLHTPNSGLIHLFYVRGQGADGSLKLAYGASPSSLTSITAATGANGNLTGSSALNFAIAGWGVNAAPNSSGFTAVHVGPGNWLQSTSCGD